MVEVNITEQNQFREIFIMSSIHNILLSGFRELVNIFSGLANSIRHLARTLLEFLNLPAQFNQIMHAAIPPEDILKDFEPIEVITLKKGYDYSGQGFFKGTFSLIKNFANSVGISLEPFKQMRAGWTAGKKEGGFKGAIKGGVKGAWQGMKLTMGAPLKEISTTFSANFGQMAALTVVLQPIMGFIGAILEPFELIGDLFETFGEALSLAFYPVIIQIIQAVVPFIPIVAQIAMLIGEVLNIIFQFTTPVGWIISALNALQITPTFDGIIQGIRDALGAAIDWLRNLPQMIWNWLIGLFSGNKTYSS